MPEKRVILHLGAPKTATTSIQFSCLYRYDDLRKQGIFYPAIRWKEEKEFDIRKPRSHAQMSDTEADRAIRGYSGHDFIFNFSRYEQPARTQDLPRPPEEMKAYWDGLLAQFREDDELHTMILSCENLFFLPHSFDLEKFVKQFEGMNVSVAIGLRHPTDLFQGLYATRILEAPRLGGEAMGFHVFPRYLRIGYQGYISGLVKKLCAPEDVCVFPTSALWSSERSVLGAFFDLVGVESDIEQDWHSRPTPGTRTISFLRRLNRAKLPDDAYYETVMTLLGVIGKEKTKLSVFPEAVQKEFHLRYRKDVQWLENRFGATGFEAERFVERPYHELNTVSEDTEMLSKIFDTLSSEAQDALRKSVPNLV